MNVFFLRNRVMTGGWGASSSKPFILLLRERLFSLANKLQGSQRIDLVTFAVDLISAIFTAGERKAQADLFAVRGTRCFTES
jgi:hypothetical protein